MFAGFTCPVSGPVVRAAPAVFAFAAEGRMLVSPAVPLPQTWPLFMQHDLTPRGWEPTVQSSFAVITVAQNQSG